MIDGQYAIEHIMKAVEVRDLVRNSLHQDHPTIDSKLVDTIFDSALDFISQDNSAITQTRLAVKYGAKKQDVIGAFTSRYTLNTLEAYVISKRGLRLEESNAR